MFLYSNLRVPPFPVGEENYLMNYLVKLCRNYTLDFHLFLFLPLFFLKQITLESVFPQLCMTHAERFDKISWAYLLLLKYFIYVSKTSSIPWYSFLPAPLIKKIT